MDDVIWRIAVAIIVACIEASGRSVPDFIRLFAGAVKRFKDRIICCFTPKHPVHLDPSTPKVELSTLERDVKDDLSNNIISTLRPHQVDEVTTKYSKKQRKLFVRIFSLQPFDNSDRSVVRVAVLAWLPPEISLDIEFRQEQGSTAVSPRLTGSRKRSEKNINRMTNGRITKASHSENKAPSKNHSRPQTKPASYGKKLSNSIDSLSSRRVRKSSQARRATPIG